MAKTQPLGVRVDQRLKSALELAAREDMRSVSSLVHKLLTEWVTERGFMARVADDADASDQFSRPVGRPRTATAQANKYLDASIAKILISREFITLDELAQAICGGSLAEWKSGFGDIPANPHIERGLQNGLIRAGWSERVRNADGASGWAPQTRP